MGTALGWVPLGTQVRTFPQYRCQPKFPAGAASDRSRELRRPLWQ